MKVAATALKISLFMDSCILDTLIGLLQIIKSLLNVGYDGIVIGNDCINEIKNALNNEITIEDYLKKFIKIKKPKRENVKSLNLKSNSCLSGD
jgi:rRNA maturation endonuclease Nob1